MSRDERPTTVGAIELKALRGLSSGYGSDWNFHSFATIASNGDLHLGQVRRAVRGLARKGLAVFASGLWTEDGTPAGSGYAMTKAGFEALRALADKEGGAS